MSTEQQAEQPAEQPPEQPPEQQGWGAPPPPPPQRPQWTTKRTVIAVAVAVGIAAAGGGVIWAASSSEGSGGRGMPQGGGMIIGGPMADSQAQHGEFQNGEVTKISDSSITVKSEDGFTETYAIDSDTMFGSGSADDVETGDKVNVMATDGTAVSVLPHEDMTGPRNGGGPGGRGGGPAQN